MYLSDRDKRIIKKGLWIIALVVVFLALFVFPVGKSYHGNGATEHYPLIPIYTYSDLYWRTGEYGENGKMLIEYGKEIRIFGIRVYKKTHLEANGPKKAEFRNHNRDGNLVISEIEDILGAKEVTPPGDQSG